MPLHGFRNAAYLNLIRIVPFEYIVLAGAGGGGGADNQTEGGGGGGAGGYRTGLIEQEMSAVLSITVGAGGNGAPTHPATPQFGSKGGTSTFAGISSAGGGSGGIARDTVSSVMDGGSGGGAAGRSTRSGFGNTPATDPAQGFNGKDPPVANQAVAGGGGGATGTGSGDIYLGGPGATSSLSGASQTYGVGGQGGRGTSTAGYVAGAPNTGTGGAGGYGRNSPAGGDQTCQGGRAGGSGVVVVRYPDSFPELEIGAGLSANPPVVSGGYRSYVFTLGSGTINIS